jgi:hypothetical protein
MASAKNIQFQKAKVLQIAEIEEMPSARQTLNEGGIGCSRRI